MPPTVMPETETPMPAVELRSLSVAFGEEVQSLRRVVHDLDLVCAAGEFVVLIGASGCGKTTVLNAIAGLIEPTAGEVRVLGGSPRAARNRLGYMLARDALLPWRTAARNVAFSLEIHGTARSERRDLAERYLNMMKLGDAANKYPWQLSQGMRQRVALARTWASEPELILMDEPFSALDAQTREMVRGEFLHLWERDRRSVVFVTHDLTEALLMADRVVVLREGRICLDQEVPFARPREAAELEEIAEFRSIRRELWRHLADHGPAPVLDPC
jgi:ABC-type nitrate/sulfonate/bicarbonate transport system ATPase subunit